MKNYKMVIFLILSTCLMLFMVAYGQQASEQSSREISSQETPVNASNDTKKVSLTVSAAASLKDAMEEIKVEFNKERPDLTITYNFGSSGALQQQIENGADVDVFISAGTKQMNTLKDKKLIVEETQKNFLENELVLVVSKESSLISDFKDLKNDKVKKIGMGEPKSVPAGQYADEVLTKLDILNSIKSKIVYGKDVKEVLAWVETGNADAGMVYETDAIASEKIKVAAKAPEGSHEPIYYPAAVIGTSKKLHEAKVFIDFIYSSKAKPVFEKYGFKFIAK
ncbi:MAG TPA: molybdate ABC transporter substrate-binding protein [Pseudobacteroides sp.]|nr:molybdate ABC transporter substrate-binding protein [Pseudobacteroides sp.]